MKTVGWWLPETERVRRLETGWLKKKSANFFQLQDE